MLENVELICEPSPANRILKIITQNNHLQYNATCNGALSGEEQNPGTVYNAIIKIKNNEEALVPIKASYYRYAANFVMGKFKQIAITNNLNSLFNLGSEAFSEYAELKNGICEGGKLSAYSVWVADDPTQGCCTTGVKKTTAVYYRLEIRGGNCCTVCNLLAANDVYDVPIHNWTGSIQKHSFNVLSFN